jgi:hypothetical protein
MNCTIPIIPSLLCSFFIRRSCSYPLVIPLPFDHVFEQNKSQSQFLSSMWPVISPNFIHKHLRTCTRALTFVPRNCFFSHPVDQPPALAPACLTAVPGALRTSSASSVNNKESQSEHEPTMTVGKQTESYPINSSSTIATIFDKPGHNEALMMMNLMILLVQIL